MAVPILKQSDYLIATVVSAVTDREWSELQDNLLERIGRYRSRGVLIDVSALDVLDSFATRVLHNTAYSIGLRGATMVIAGIQPEVAFGMVQMGLGARLARTATVLDLEEGLGYLDRLIQGMDTHAR